MNKKDVKNVFVIARDIRRQLSTFGAKPYKSFPSLSRGMTIIIAERDLPGQKRFSTHAYLHNTQCIVSGVYDLDFDQATESFKDRIAEMLGGA